MIRYTLILGLLICSVGCFGPGNKTQRGAGQGAIIGLNSVVTKDVPENAIVVGNPAQVIKYRDKEKVESLIKDKKFN